MIVRSDAAAEIVVHAATGEVCRLGTVVPLSRVETQLAVAIAVQAYPVSVERLSMVLYPDRRDVAARNMVKVYVHRLRRRIGADFIVHRHGGYVIGPRAMSDVVEARHFMCRYAGGRAIPPHDGERMLRIARNLRRPAPAALLECEWYDAVALLAHRLGHDVPILIARSALASGEPAIAATAARELTYEDACDEESWEVLIRSQLRRGEIAAARRGYQCYATALAESLDARPSPALARLVDMGRDAVSA